MSVAYNSKVLCYPMETFSSLYLLDAVKVTLMCQEHKVAVEGSDKICFSKATFQPNDKVFIMFMLERIIIFYIIVLSLSAQVERHCTNLRGSGQGGLGVNLRT